MAITSQSDVQSPLSRRRCAPSQPELRAEPAETAENQSNPRRRPGSLHDPKKSSPPPSPPAPPINKSTDFRDTHELTGGTEADFFDGEVSERQDFNAGEGDTAGVFTAFENWVDLI